MPNIAIAQCAIGQTSNTYCYAPNEVNNVAFEFCPNAGEIAQSTIVDGTMGNELPNTLTVYEGTSGSGTAGTIVFGPFTGGSLVGTTITASAIDLCLIFVINSSPTSLACSDGFDDEIVVCSESLPASTVTFVAPADLCINAGVQTGLGGGSPGGGVYSGPGVTNDGNGMTYSFDPVAAGVGVHTLTYTVGGNFDTDDIEVFALPVVSFTALADLCIDAGVQSGLGGGSPAGGVYSGSGVTDNGDGTYDFNPAIAGLGVHTITYTEPGVCGASASDDVEVLAACGCPIGQTNYFYCSGSVPVTDLVAFEVCPGSGFAAQATITAGTFDAAGSSIRVYEGATGSGTSGTIVFGPSSGDVSGTMITGSGVNDCLIFVINNPSGIGCQSGLDTPLQVCGEDIAPSVNFTAPDDLCIDSGVQTGLSGGLPLGGVYSGAGVTDDGNGMTYSFDPAAAGVGVHTLTYTVGGNSDTDDIEVFAIPTVTFGSLPDVCIDAGIQTGLGGVTPTGGVFSGPGVTDDGNGVTFTFNPTAAGFGVHTITYTESICAVTATSDLEVIAACGCPAGQTSFYNCYANNELDLVIFEVCPTAGKFAQAEVTMGTYDNLDFLTVYRGTSGSGTSGTIVFGPANGNLFGTVITSSVADECLIFVSNSNASVSCADGSELPLVVCGSSLDNVVNFTALADLSINAGVQTGVSGGTPIGGVYSGPGVTDDGNGMTYSFDPVAAGVGTHTLTYTFGGNSASDDVQVLNILPPAFSKSFNPTSIGSGAISTLTFTIDNSSSGTPLTNINFTDNLPAGMTVASTPAVNQNCFAGTVTAVPGATSISFANGELTGFGVCTISVNVTATASGTNTTGDLTSSAGNSGTASANLTVQNQCPIFTKSFSPSTINLGEISTLTFTIDNTAGAGNLIGATFIDNLPTGMTIADPPNVTTSCGGLTVTANPGSSTINVTSNFTTTVAAGASCTITVDVVGNISGALENVTENFSIRNSGFQLFNCGSAAATLNVLTPPEIFIQKTFVTNPVSPGGTTDLEFTLTNLNRDFPATNVSFTDDLTTVLAGLSAIGTPLNDICGTGSQLSGTTLLTFTGGTIPANGSCTITVPLQVPAGAASGTYINTTGAVTADINGNSVTGNTATANLTVASVPNFTKTFLTDPIVAGGTTTLEFTITNTSTTDALTDIAFSDNISQFLSGAILTSLPPAGSCGAGSLFFTTLVGGDLVFMMTGGNMAAGASCTFSIDVAIPTGVNAASYPNSTSYLTGNIAGQTVTATPATDDLTVLAVPQLSKSFTDDPVEAGDVVNLEFTLTYDDFASGDATNVSFTDDLNAVIPGLAAIGLPLNDICGTGSSISGTTNLTFSGGTLSPGGSCTFSVPVQVPAGVNPGSYTNVTSAVTATVGGQTATGNSATDNLLIGGLNFSKTFIGGPVVPGDLTTLRFTIENTTTFDATNVVFTDNLNTVLPGLLAEAPIPASPCGGTFVASGDFFLIFSGGSVPQGTTCTFDVPVRVPANANPGTYTNISSNMTASINGTTIVLDPAVDDLVVENNYIALSKTFIDDPVAPGGSVTVEYTLTNLDPANPISNIAFTDDFDGILTGLAATGLPAAACGGTVSGTGLLSFSGGSLAAGAFCTFMVTLQVPGSAPFGAIYPSTTSGVTGEINSLPVLGDPASDDLFIQSIELTKSMTGPVLPGGTSTITFTLTNYDPVNAFSDIAFTDDLDAFISGATAVGLPLNGICGPNSGVNGTSIINFGRGDLGPGQSCSFDVDVMIPCDAADGTYTNITSQITTSTINAPGATAQLTVNAPSLNFTAPPDFCLNAGVQLGMGQTTTPTGGVFSGPGVTDDNNGTSFTFDPATAGVGVHTLTYTYTNTNGCVYTATDDIEIFDLPTVGFTAPADLCINAGVQAGLGGGTPPEGTVTGDMGVYSGMGVSDDGNGMTYSFDPAIAGVGVHTLTYTYTDENGCSNSATDDIQVFALPNVMFTAPADLCVNDGVQSGLGGGTPTGGVYSGPGVTDDGNGMTYSFNPASAGGAGIGTHTITYTVGVSGCTASANDDVQVFSIPSIDITVPQTFCADDPVTTVGPIVFPSAVSVVYSGTGVSDNGNNNDFEFDVPTVGVGVHPVTVTSTNANGCSNVQMVNMTVLALPTVAFTAPADLCINAGVQAGLGGGTPPEGTVTGDMGVYSGMGVTDDGNGMTYSFDPAVAGVGVHTLTYTYTDENGCSNSASDMIEVYALPTVMFTAPANLCIDAGVQAGLGGGTPPQGTATGDDGAYSGPGVTDDGNGMTYSFDPAAAGVGVHTLTYTYTDENGCSASASDMIEVYALPTVMFTAPTDLCIDAGVQVGLGGGTPPQGTATGDDGAYSGPGVTDDGNGMTYSFDPAAAGVGVHTLTYTYTDENGCDASATDMVEVFALPTVMFTAPADLCINDGVQAGLGGGTPPQGTVSNDNGVYSGPGVTDDSNGMTYSFDPATAGVGVHTLTYTYTDDNGCTNSATDMVEVFALPTVSFTAPAPDVCIMDPIVTGLGGGMPMGGVYSGLGVTDDGNGMTFSFDPSASDPMGGNIPVTYTYTDTNGCIGSATDDIFVDPICCDLVVDCSNITDTDLTCRADLPPVDFDLPIIIDSCGNVIRSALTIIPGNSGCPGDLISITRTYFLQDQQGNMDECVQVFTIQSDNAPMITCPADMTVECAADINVSASDAVVTTDCTGPAVTLSGPAIAGDPDCPMTTYTYTYTVTDHCNRMASCQQVFTIQNAGPTITCPADMTVECAADISVDPNDAVVVTACTLGSNVVISGPVTAGDPDCPETILEYTYTVTDDCGRMASCIQTFTIRNDAPIITCPADVTVACAADIVVATTDATVVTSCGIGFNVGITGPKIIGGNPDCPETEYRYHYTVIDDCGRQALCTRSFFIENTGPTITCPADMTVECASDIIVDPDLVSFTTSCDMDADITAAGPVLVDGNDGCNGAVYSVTYFIRDNCGRTGQCVQRWSLVNSGDPVILECPPTRIAECVADIEDESNAVKALVICDADYSVTASAPVPLDDLDNCDGAEYEVTYTVTDACGGTATCTQIWIMSNEGPRIIVPDPITVACLDDVNPDISDIEIETGCGTPIIKSDVSGPIYNMDEPLCEGSIVNFLYEVYDACGRYASEAQIVTISLAADPGPQFEDMTVECGEVPPPLTVIESCGTFLNLEVDEFPTTLPNGNKRIERIYTTTDACGNSIKIVQVIIEDCNSAPQLREVCMLSEKTWMNNEHEQEQDPFRHVKLTEDVPFIVGFGDRQIIIEDMRCLTIYFPAEGTPRPFIEGMSSFKLNPKDDCRVGIDDPDPLGTMNNKLLSKLIALGLNLRADPTMGDVELKDICVEINVPFMDGIPDANIQDLYNVAEAAVAGFFFNGSYEDLTTALAKVVAYFSECPTLPCQDTPDFFTRPEINVVSDQMTVYPNPTRDYIKVKVGYEKLEGTVLRIFSSVGTLQFEVPTNSSGHQELDVQALPPGLYHVMLMINDNVISYEKFVRQY